jgi:hypothetical protein
MSVIKHYSIYTIVFFNPYKIIGPFMFDFYFGSEAEIKSHDEDFVIFV